MINLIPPIEEFKRTQIKVNPDLRSFKEVSQERMKFMKKNKASTLLSDSHKTFANKLDDFMTSNTIQFNGENSKKIIPSFTETGLPQAIPDASNNQTDNKNTPLSNN